MRDVSAVREVMVRDFVGASEGDDLREVARLLSSDRDGPAVVLRGAEPVGTLTRADAIDGLLADEATTVGDAMSDPLPTVSPDERATAARARLAAADRPALLVVEGEPLGVVGADDLLGALAAIEPETAPPTGETPEASAGPMDDRGAAGDVFAERGEADAGEANETSTQSVCEACGGLSMDLASVNGTLLCPDCRDI
ncbi:MAG: cyclic nucleotide-binding/CBS domain-containing protein [Halolamina sp.]